MKTHPFHPLRVVLMVLLAALLAAVAGPVLANTTWRCLPKEYGGSGAYFAQVADQHGKAAGWLCTGPTPADDWIFTLVRLNSGGMLPTCNTTVAGALNALTTAAKPLDVANALLAECGWVPAAGTQQRAQFDALNQLAVNAVRARMPPSTPPTGPVWRTPPGGSSVYPVANGRLGAPLAGRRAAGNALCDLAALMVRNGPYTYGAFPGGAANEAALCVQVAL